MSNAIVSFNFDQKRVLITGGTSGMGEATAVAFVEAGANVMISGRNQDRGAAIIDRLNKSPGSIDFVQGDISQSEQCNNIVEHSVKALGGLDIVVNSAGIIYHATAEETSDAQWQETMNVNVNGMFYICRAAIPHLKTGGGTIVNIASDAALSGVRWRSITQNTVFASCQSARVTSTRQCLEGNFVIGDSTPKQDLANQPRPCR